MARTQVSSRLDRATQGTLVRCLPPLVSQVSRAVLLFGLILGLSVQPAFAGKPAPTPAPVPAASGTGSCGVAVVDGRYGEWDLSRDLYAAMHEAGDPSKSLLSNLYLRYDSTTQTAYVLVLARSGYQVQQTTGDAWVKFYSWGQSPVPFTAFQWVLDGAGTPVGYEASFKLAPGTYTPVEVHVEIQSGRTSSTGKNSGAKANPISLITPVCIAAPKVALGNRVWIEVNGQPGYQPGGLDPDRPVTGVAIELTGPFGGSTLATATTGSDGCYLFDNLNRGDYAVRIPASQVVAGGVLAGYVPMAAGSGAADDNVDQNGVAQPGGEVITGVYSVQPGLAPKAEAGEAAQACTSVTTNLVDANVDLTADFAFQPAPVVKVALGNQVYKEVNGTAGYQAAGDNPDLPLAGVEVDLYDANGPTGETKTTGDDGCYLFDNLAGGSYYAVLPADQFGPAGALKGLRAAATGLGNDAATDDPADHNGTAAADGTVKSNTIVLTPGTQPEHERATACTSSLPDKNTNLTVDFALEDKPITEVAIGNRVWKDMDSDGKFTQDTDLPLSGVTVTVVDNEDATKIHTATTDGNGCYLVRGLTAGAYVAKILAGQSALNGLQGVAIDPDYALAGDDEITDDSGDQNGVQYPDLGGDTQTAVYNLAPGTMPTNDASSAACGLAALSDADGVVLPDANVNETADFAFKEIPPPPVKVGIGDRVYYELNGLPGYQSGEDLPVAAVPVEVVAQGSDTATMTVTTDAKGCYLAEGLDAGTYVVRLPKTLFAAGGTLFGYSPALGGADVADQDENVDHNARWELNGQVKTGAIVSQGYNLQPGTMPTSTGTNALELNPAAPDTCAGEVTLPDLNVNRTADLAISELAAVGNLLWQEGDNTDGFSAAGGDLGIDNVEVQLHRTDVDGNPLLDGNGTPVVDVRSMKTQGGGFYLFDNLQPGYFVLKIPAAQFQAEGPLNGYTSALGNGDGTLDTDDDSGESTPDENGLDTIDPTADGIVSPVFELRVGYLPENEPGQRPAPSLAATNPALFSNLQDYNTDLTRDLAVVMNQGGGSELEGSIGSTVFIDANWNGTQDATVDANGKLLEPGIEGVEVRLYGPGQPAEGGVIFTNAQGEWLFSGLEAGHYQVKLPDAQMIGSGTVAQAVSTYFGTHGIPTTVPTKVTATNVSVYLDTSIRQDGDSNGVQGGYGGEIVSDDVLLTYGAAPLDRPVGSTDTGPGIEFPQTMTSNGYKQDLDFDGSGDMTVDFGVVHQCYDICDHNRNGTIDQSDIDWIASQRLKAPIPGPGMPGSGNCGVNVRVTTNDKLWCESLMLNQTR